MEVNYQPNDVAEPIQAPADRLMAARQIMQGEAAAIVRIAEQLDSVFLAVVDTLADCAGQVIISGMGKAGLIGQKLSATFASTGTRSLFLHPAEAVHGDLGRVDRDDILLLLSYSGETEELNRLLPALKSQTRLIVAITSSANSSLGRAADYVLPLGALREVCPLGLAPSTSTAAMLALGDALALSVSQSRGFTREAFARNHPAGNLGRQLSPVDDVMRPLDQCRVASCQTTLCDVLVKVSRPGRRSGAVMLLDAQQRLVGIFTDSDLARLLEQRRHAQLDHPIAEVMTTTFRTIASGQPLSAAIELLSQYKISELPVVDQLGVPVGMIDITDVVGLVTHAEQLQAAQQVTTCCVAEDGQLISVPMISPTER
ncbi:MAG: KpsF/GutQ family sugar-phosphate isomerase [Pirellulaceae bacterium]|nr:KpsF/GutQ family sugar-phosphate isomerase [Pirellulaceae bacterium]